MMGREEPVLLPGGLETSATCGGSRAGSAERAVPTRPQRGTTCSKALIPTRWRAPAPRCVGLHPKAGATRGGRERPDDDGADHRRRRARGVRAAAGRRPHRGFHAIGATLRAACVARPARLRSGERSDPRRVRPNRVDLRIQGTSLLHGAVASRVIRRRWGDARGFRAPGGPLPRRIRRCRAVTVPCRAFRDHRRAAARTSSARRPGVVRTPAPAGCMHPCASCRDA